MDRTPFDVREDAKMISMIFGSKILVDPVVVDPPTVVVPPEYDFRNVSSVQSYWTEDKNENAGSYCASGWAQAVTSAVSDRLSFLHGGVWPPINLSPQVLLNCHSGGGCRGGNIWIAYRTLVEQGLPDSTCQAYSAKDDDSSSSMCDDIHTCEECFAGDTDATFWPGTCHARPKHKTWFLSSFGSITNSPDKMKAEIFVNGPITCGIFASTAFLHYTGGYVIEHNAPNPWTVNHAVEVAGWGVDKYGEEFWIARNSWGTFWGELGWFRIRMHRKNLNIEKSCAFGIFERDQGDEQVEIETE